MNIDPLPIDQYRVCQFVATLAAEQVSHSSIKGYLSALRHLQIYRLGYDPNVCDMTAFRFTGPKEVASNFGTGQLATDPLAPHREHNEIAKALLGSGRCVVRQGDAVGSSTAADWHHADEGVAEN